MRDGAGRAFGARVGALLLTVVGLVVAVAWPSTARAFCREVTEKTPGDYNPQQFGCFAGTGATPSLPVFWRNQCISYSLQMNGSAKVPLSVASSIAFQAFYTWTNGPAATCSTGAGPSIQA